MYFTILVTFALKKSLKLVMEIKLRANYMQTNSTVEVIPREGGGFKHLLVKIMLKCCYLLRTE